MRRFRKRFTLVALLTLAAVLYFRQRNAQIAAEDAARAARIAALQTRVNTMLVQRRAALRVIDSLNTAYRGDTARLTRQRDRWRSILASIDTTPRIDSVPMPPDTVRLIVRVADSTITACTMALSTCERRVGAEKARADSADVRAALSQQMVDSLSHPPRKPLWWRALKKGAEWYTVWRTARATR